MFGRVRASASSADSLEGSPSQILKHDSFSIYEATLMKLKLGAKRDISESSQEMDDVMSDSTSSSSCVEANSALAKATSSQDRISSCSEDMMIDSDGSSISPSRCSSDRDSTTGDSQQRRHKNVSIAHLFSKFEGSKIASGSSSQESTSTKSGCSTSISSSSTESHCRSETECVHSSPVIKL